jgi:hypothetical protein
MRAGLVRHSPSNWSMVTISDDPFLVSGRRTLIASLESAKCLTVLSKETFRPRSLNTSDLGKDPGGHHVASPLAPGRWCCSAQCPRRHQ